VSKKNPISPKAHGAWIGGGAGAYVANQVVALISQWTHHPLATPYATLIYGVTPPVLAFLGAWLAPLLPQTMTQSAVVLAPPQPIQPAPMPAQQAASWPQDPVPVMVPVIPQAGSVNR
jgi:hypothetical protein